jgi:hypothetical protein
MVFSWPVLVGFYLRGGVFFEGRGGGIRFVSVLVEGRGEVGG